MNGSLAMSAGKYDVLLFAEHLYASALELKHQMHNYMCVMDKGTTTRLSYNTNNGAGTKWNQYRGTGIALNADMRARVTKDGRMGGGIQQTMNENWRQRWNCYCLRFNIQTLSQPRRLTYGVAAASWVL